MTYLIDGTTSLPENGESGWGTTLNAAINAIDGRFTYQSASSIPATKALASGIVGTTLASNVVTSSLTTVGTLTALSVTGNVTVGGDLTVNGTTTTISTTELAIEDNIITLNSTVTGAPSTNAGIEVERGTSTNVAIRWNETSDVWEFTTDGSAYSTFNAAGSLTGSTLASGVTSSSLTTVGTIATGVWNGTVVEGQYGGTGVANTGKTITVSGNTTIGSSTHTVAFVTSGNTSVTLPTSGTLVNSDVATLSSLASIGTVTTGTWNGSIIAGQYGGTGVNNSGKTITLGGNLTTSGAYALTLTSTDTTNVTLPTTGTLATLAGSESLTNKKLGSLTTNGIVTTSSGDGTLSVTSTTGSGNVVLATSPQLTTSLTTDSATFALVNTTATTVNFAGAATALSIGAASGTTTVNNGLTVTGTTVLGPASITQQSSTYTLASSDQGKIIEMTNSTDVVVTVPPDSTSLPVGTQIVVVRNNTGKVEFAAGAGVAIYSDASKLFISTQYSAATLIKRASNTWYLIGNLAAS